MNDNDEKTKWLTNGNEATNGKNEKLKKVKSIEYSELACVSRTHNRI